MKGWKMASVYIGVVVSILTGFVLLDDLGVPRPVMTGEHKEWEIAVMITREEQLENRIDRIQKRVYEFQQELRKQEEPPTDIQKEYELLLQRQIERDGRELDAIREQQAQ